VQPSIPEPAALNVRSALVPLGVALFAVSLLAIGGWMLFTNLAFYDDEGYILISAREYFAHGRLYEVVYSQYGPAFYVLTDFLQHLLGAPIDNTSARLLTLGFWFGTAASCAALVHRQTGSLRLTYFTLTSTFLFLYFITDEPFHPGSLVTCTLALSALATAELIGRDRINTAAALAGGTAAVLLLAKINVGVFYVAAVGVWALLHSVPARWRRLTGATVVVLLSLLAIALMHTLWREPWVQIFLTVFAAGALALVTAINGTGLVRPKNAAWFAGTAIGVAVAVLTVIWLRGTSVQGLLEGVLLGPLRHPGNYSYAVDWRPGTLAVAGLSLGLALALPWIRGRFSEEIADRLIVGLRLVLATGLVLGFALLMHARVIGAIFSYVAPLIWIWVVPLSGVSMPRAFHLGRSLVACVLLLQFLHAYPVGGIQLAWGTFLFWALAALGLGEVRLWFNRSVPSAPRLGRTWPVLATALLLVSAGKIAWTATTAHNRYTTRNDLGLPGASGLRLPEPQRTAYQILALNAAAHADVLFSLPGMFSFNVWTGLPTPTLKNTTLWFTLLNEAEQAEIIRSIEANPRTCIIVQELLVQLMAAGNVPMRGPLHDYLHANFTPAFRVEQFAFLVRRGRDIAPLNLARLSSARAGLETRVALNLTSKGAAIQRIEIRDVASPLDAPPVQILDASNAAASVALINRSGALAGRPTAISWPLRFDGLAQLTLSFDRGGVDLAPASTALYLIGVDGKTLGLARVIE